MLALILSARTREVSLWSSEDQFHEFRRSCVRIAMRSKGCRCSPVGGTGLQPSPVGEAELVLSDFPRPCQICCAASLARAHLKCDAEGIALVSSTCHLMNKEG